MKYLWMVLLVACASEKKLETDLWTQYAALLEKHPVKEKLHECKRPELKSSSYASKYKSVIEKELDVMIQPNFNGAYRMINVPGTMGGDWFVSDCRTGKFVKAKVQGEVLFSIESSLIVRHPPGQGETIETYKAPAHGRPEIYKFDEATGNFILQENTIQR